MIVSLIGLGVFFVLQIVTGLTILFNVQLSDRAFLGLLMLYVLVAGFVLGSTVA